MLRALSQETSRFHVAEIQVAKFVPECLDIMLGAESDDQLTLVIRASI